MPVPASMNDITTDKNIKNHVGKVVYETTFSLPVREKRAYRVRVGATSHKAKVYLNWEFIGEVINGFFSCRFSLDECEFCIGEHVWNLFDFKTKQGLTRVRGKRKGVFTKDRQPKASAFFLKNRWKNK